MKALTLRNIPRRLQVLIERRARQNGLSLSRAVLMLLEEEASRGRALHHDLDRLAGTWTPAEAEQAERRLAELRSLGPREPS